ncbi:nucleotidyltransferase domain-containing protein [Anaerosporobacter sp.]
MENIKELVREISNLPEVTAITFGGSRASGYQDENSDYDVYVYLENPVPIEKRTVIPLKNN